MATSVSIFVAVEEASEHTGSWLPKLCSKVWKHIRSISDRSGFQTVDVHVSDATADTVDLMRSGIIRDLISDSLRTLIALCFPISAIKFGLVEQRADENSLFSIITS